MVFFDRGSWGKFVQGAVFSPLLVIVWRDRPRTAPLPLLLAPDTRPFFSKLSIE